MHLIIFFIIALIPLFAVAKVISKQTGIGAGKVFWYGVFWIVSLLLLLSGEPINNVISIFLFPFVVHIAFKVIISIFRWSIDVLSKD